MISVVADARWCSPPCAFFPHLAYPLSTSRGHDYTGRWRHSNHYDKMTNMEWPGGHENTRMVTTRGINIGVPSFVWSIWQDNSQPTSQQPGAAGAGKSKENAEIALPQKDSRLQHFLWYRTHLPRLQYSRQWRPARTQWLQGSLLGGRLRLYINH